MTAVKTGTSLLTIPETAERLRCSDKHVYRLITDGKLQVTYIGRGSKPITRVREDSLTAYISA